MVLLAISSFSRHMLWHIAPMSTTECQLAAFMSTRPGQTGRAIVKHAVVLAGSTLLRKSIGRYMGWAPVTHIAQSLQPPRLACSCLCATMPR